MSIKILYGGPIGGLQADHCAFWSCALLVDERFSASDSRSSSDWIRSSSGSAEASHASALPCAPCHSKRAA